MSYTINRTGENIAALLDKVEEGAVGKITIGIEQVMNLDPVQVQITEEQLAVIASHNVIEIDASQIDFPSCTWVKDTVGWYTALRCDNYGWAGHDLEYTGLNVITIDNDTGIGTLMSKDNDGGMTPEERAELASHEARIVNLEAAAKGILYREEIDSTEAYVKTVPDGALPYAAVTEVQGVDGYDPTEILCHGVNILNVGLTYGKAISSTDGTLTNAALRYSGYLDVSRFRGLTIAYSMKNTTTLSRGMAFYDAGKKFISGKKISSGNSTIVPDNAAYARFTFDTEEREPVPMVVLGDTISDMRVPYRDPVSYPADSLPVFIPVSKGEYLTFENDTGEMIPLPSSVTYAINVQEAIANE